MFYHHPRVCPPEMIFANAPANPKATIDPKLMIKYLLFLIIDLLFIELGCILTKKILTEKRSKHMSHC